MIIHFLTDLLNTSICFFALLKLSIEAIFYYFHSESTRILRIPNFDHHYYSSIPPPLFSNGFITAKTNANKSAWSLAVRDWRSGS
jgi:hypothetical protein